MDARRELAFMVRQGCANGPTGAERVRWRAYRGSWVMGSWGLAAWAE